MSSVTQLSSLQRAYKRIENCVLDSLFDKKSFTYKIAHWRDKDPSIVRKITFGSILAVGAIAGLVDTVASVVFGILSSPLELVGYQFSRRFFKRAADSAVLSRICSTTAQRINFFGKNFLKEILNK